MACENSRIKCTILHSEHREVSLLSLLSHPFVPSCSNPPPRQQKCATSANNKHTTSTSPTSPILHAFMINPDTPFTIVPGHWMIKGSFNLHSFIVHTNLVRGSVRKRKARPRLVRKMNNMITTKRVLLLTAPFCLSDLC